MINLKKWNYETHEYDIYPVPKEWNCKLISADMSEVINCASCGNKITYGSSYSSLEIHNEYGLGYGVCEHCHQKEVLRRLANE